MAEAERKGHTITFDVLYYAKSRGKVDRMVEIGEKEGEYIRIERWSVHHSLDFHPFQPLRHHGLQESLRRPVQAVHEADRKPQIHHQRITEGEQSPSKRRRDTHEQRLFQMLHQRGQARHQSSGSGTEGCGSRGCLHCSIC